MISRLTSSTAHIGPWYDMIFVAFEVHAMLIIPMEKICKDQRSFETRSSIGGNFSCFSHSNFLIKRGFKPPPTISLFACYQFSEFAVIRGNAYMSFVPKELRGFTHSSYQGLKETLIFFVPSVWKSRGFQQSFQ